MRWLSIFNNRYLQQGGSGERLDQLHRAARRQRGILPKRVMEAHELELTGEIDWTQHEDWEEELAAWSRLEGSAASGLLRRWLLRLSFGLGVDG